MSSLVYGVPIDNPTGVWHELKNAQLRLRDGGWIQGWFAQDGMCLANALRFVVHGEKNKPKSFDHADVLTSERLVFAIIEKHAPEFVDDNPRFAEAIRRGQNPYTSIPDFNDAGNRTLAQVLRVLDLALDAVRPLAFEHTVTMATDIMTPEERAEIDAAVRKDLWASWTRAFKSGRTKKAKNPVVQQFSEWLDSFEERGWDTFWDELAECDTPDCEKMREELGV